MAPWLETTEFTVRDTEIITGDLFILLWNGESALISFGRNRLV
jgi:hypothetical protein